MTLPKLRIIHETNPKKYFPALFELADEGHVDLVGTHRYSVCKEWLRAALRDKTPIGERTRNAVGDLLLRYKVPFIKDETIVIGFAPWDWRLLIYRTLARRNKILYQTSWHDWSIDNTPRQPKPSWLKRVLQKQWHAFVAHPNVRVIAVTPVVADTVKQETGVTAQVIPHAVPEVFFEAGRNRPPRGTAPLKLMYVGEISEKKGIKILLDMVERLKETGLTLTVVGNGPLVSDVKRASDHVTYLGPIYDRAKLAQVMAEHDVLMLLSQKTATWEELFGIVVVEALATGMAVLASDHVGPRGILAPAGGAGLLDQSEQNDFFASVKEFTADNRKLTALKHAQSAIAPNYQIERISASWKEIIVS